MRLRTQSLLAILPLFLLIGVTGAGAAWLLKSRDWRQGVEEQARGVAAGLAEFVGREHWIEAEPVAQARLHLAEERLARWEFVKRIRVRNVSGQLIHQWSDDADQMGEFPADPEYWVPVGDANDNNAHAVGRFVADTDGGAVAWGGAMVWDEAGDPIGWVECELDASGWEAAHTAELRGMFYLIGGIIILGTLMAWLFNQLVVGDIRKLIQSARGVGEGEFVKPDGLKVSELQDLSEAFSVVDSLTHENRMKFRRSLIENEIFRTNTVLVDTFKESMLPDFDRVLMGRRVISRLFDQANGVRWHGGGQTSARGWMWYGAVRGAEGIETAVRALAVGSELEMMLLNQNVDPEETLKELLPLYDLTHITILSWTSARSEIERWTATSGEATSGDVEPNRETLRADRFLAHDLGGDMAATIEVVWDGSRDKSADDALGELQQFLGATNAVITVIVPDSGKDD
ncbi:hypothetical protein N9K67_00655 [Opitutaceae bacterium]|nr:hypothetical protein [Opitutaceae bacterium]